MVTAERQAHKLLEEEHGLGEFQNVSEQSRELSSGILNSQNMSKRLKILHITPEADPYARTGGLADVLGSLPFAQAACGHEVSIFLPFYRMVQEGQCKIFKERTLIKVPIGDRIDEGTVLESRYGQNVRVFFLRQDKYFDRPNLYGTSKGDYPDNAERFTFFCRSLLCVLEALDYRPDIVHCHDWQTGLVPVYMKTLWQDKSQFSASSVCYTIHNLAYQGVFPMAMLPFTELPPEVFTMNGLEFWGKISFMKAGINYSDVITTVSPTYAREIQTPEFGCGLDGVLKKRNSELFGVLNGIDTNEWNPARDECIAAQYDRNNLSGKEKCKEDLLQHFGMDKSMLTIPLCGVFSRLVDHKGFDLIAEVMDDLLSMNVGFVLLGNGDLRYQKIFSEIARKYPCQTGMRFSFQKNLAHKIAAGCDMVLMPSRFEPCGLIQIYSLRYGTIPVVRTTGGLIDTVEQFDKKTGKGCGFRFVNYSAEEFLVTIQEAINTYEDKKVWRRLIQNAMQVDFSWDRSVEKYNEVYEFALDHRKKTKK